MRFWILLTFLAAAVWAQPNPDDDKLTGGDVSNCADKCVAHFAELKSGNSKSCQTGCRLLSIIETVDFDPATGDFEATIKNCNTSCDASFKYDPEDQASCKLGCSIQAPLSKARREKMSSSLDSFFGNGNIFSMPRIRIAFPSSSFNSPDSIFGNSNGLQDMFSSNSDIGGFGGVFDRMRQQMHDMMSKVMSGDMDGVMQVPKGGAGRLVVIKSGPGFHEEKTYDFGPDGVNTEVKTSGNNKDDDVAQFGDDMMDKSNPLERRVVNGDVEIFEPRKTNSDNSNNADKSGKKSPVFGADIVRPYESSASINGFDFGSELEGPRLPEEGLRARDSRMHSREEICAQNSENMKWSDWVSCLHMRMGLPRWLTAATLSLGIVFIIWLCLVIPHNAPKQRVKITKAMEAAGKLEKEHLANLNMHPQSFKIDLPPSYDDIANLHVAVPVAQEEAGPIPEKKKPEEEVTPKV